MDVLSSLEGLRSLHRDLQELAESKLVDLERLGYELDANLKAFRTLVDKPAKSEKSRQSVSKGEKEIRVSLCADTNLLNYGGNIETSDGECEINDEFRQNILQLADALNLDEKVAAWELYDAQEDARLLDRSILTASIIRFHQRRSLVLECFRLLLRQSTDLDGDQRLR